MLLRMCIFSQSLDDVINSENRTLLYKERDKYRNPIETLSFFDIEKKGQIFPTICSLNRELENYPKFAKSRGNT